MLRYANVTAQASGCDVKLQHVGASGYPYGWGCLGNSVWPAHCVSRCCVCWNLAQRVVSQSWGVYSCVLRMFGVRCFEDLEFKSF